MTTSGALPVECVGLEKTFSDFWGRPRVRALHPLTLSVEPGEVLALLGPNGAGKSTTIKLLLGLLRPTRGQALLFGGSPLSPAARARVGYLPEETRLFRFLDASETLDLFGRLHGVDRAERRRRAQQLIEMVGLQHAATGRPVGEFSKGMARRIGLAVALSGDPDLVILDEPTSGLDPLGTRDMKDLILELKRRGRTVVLSSHLLDDVEDVADRIAILYGGKLRRLGATGELLARSDRVRLELDRPADLDTERLVDDLRAVVPGAGRVEVTTPQDRLEDLFRRVVEEAQAGHEETAGARAGGPIAAFLGGPGAATAPRPVVPPPPRATPAAPAAPATAPATPTTPGPRPEPLVQPRVEALAPVAAPPPAVVRSLRLESLLHAREVAPDVSAPASVSGPTATGPRIEALRPAAPAPAESAAKKNAVLGRLLAGGRTDADGTRAP